MIRDEGWCDTGASTAICGEHVNSPTCHCNDKAKETRIDYIITNQFLTPVASKGRVDNESGFPTHRPFAIDVEAALTNIRLKKLRKPDDFSEMFEEKVQKVIAAAREEKKMKKSKRRARDDVAAAWQEAAALEQIPEPMGTSRNTCII